jgi:hypothetical protein
MKSRLYNIQHQLLDWKQLIACLYSVAGFIDDDQYKWLLPKTLGTESLISALNTHHYLILLSAIVYLSFNGMFLSGRFTLIGSATIKLLLSVTQQNVLELNVHCRTQRAKCSL